MTRVPIGGGAVPEITAAFHEAPTATGVPVALTHGAGGDLDGAGLVALAEGLSARGHPVVRFNLPYREAGRGSPPRAERSAAAFADIVGALSAAVGIPGPWVVGGKSYGGRVASLAVAAGASARGLLFYGYPLHPPGRPERLRVDHWGDIGVPTLFLQGTRDPFCDLELLRTNLHRLAAPHALRVVDGGDHSLAVRAVDARDGRRRDGAVTVAELTGEVADWLDSLPH